MEKYLYIALFAPLIGSLFSSVFAMNKKNIAVGIMSSIFIAFSFISSLMLLAYVDKVIQVHVKLFDWIIAGGLNLAFGFVVDQVSVIMMVTVTTVSLAVHIYSIGYMAHDKSFNRFFAYLSAFVFSMLILVMSDNFLGLFIGWEGVGLCSWMLIGFWYERQSASWAANEAFIMNRIADLGMLLGLFLIYWQVGSLNYSVVFASVSLIHPLILAMIGIFLFIGAMGKSAQFPLHTWLADAMEGPTPVSALIHAATMVTAGVYLVVRASPLYSLIPEVSFFIASLGAFVAVFAASMALVNEDLKRIIAYSTLSQLGYMFVAAGLGAYWIALFHLMTHAFFKSLLFLGAGNVMHAMDDELNIKKMGGLYQSMKYTAILMIIASVALSGIYPFAGFFSKDKILEVAFFSHSYILWAMLFLGAGLTAFYSFRLIMLVFFGKKIHLTLGFKPHEVQSFVLFAMLPLGILSIISGFFEHSFYEYVTFVLPHFDMHLSLATRIVLIILTSAIAIFGICFAIYKYNKGGFSKNIENTFIYRLIKNQYYIPSFYEEIFMKNYSKLSKLAWQTDKKIIDKGVDLTAKILENFGFNLNKMQTGKLSDMLRLMILGIVVLLLFALLKDCR